MPKAAEAPTQHYQRISPLSAPGGITSPRHYPNIAANMQSEHMSQHMSQPHIAPYATGGPVQPLQHYQQPMPGPQPIPVRASSGAWTPADDAQLMAARAQGLNWAPIQAQYFPTKTPNACRKRHERLMDRRNSDDWDAVKFETLAKEYMGMRREIWAPLGAKTGEKWSVVEAKCMQQGLKNLQAAARACSRRERLEGGSSFGLGPSSSSSASGGGGLGMSVHDPRSYTEDSGVGLDDLDGDGYPHSEAGTGSYGQSSPEDDPRGSVAGTVRAYPNPVGRGYDPGHRRTYDGSYDGGRGYGREEGYGAPQQMMRGSDRDVADAYGGMGQQQRPQYLQQRLPSIDMGIGAIINRTPGAL